jgi:hypothetical protein
MRNLRQRILKSRKKAPERGVGIPNWFYYVKENFEEFVPQTEIRALQIGAYAGDFSKWLLENRTVIRLDDVDTWKGSDDEGGLVTNWKQVFKYYSFQMRGFRNVNVYRTISDDFFKSIPETHAYNFVYIDGSHLARQVLTDGLNAFEHLELHGIMVFDDYLWNNNVDPYKNPKLGIDAFLKFHEGNLEVVMKEYQVWIKKVDSLEVKRNGEPTLEN